MKRLAMLFTIFVALLFAVSCYAQSIPKYSLLDSPQPWPDRSAKKTTDKAVKDAPPVSDFQFSLTNLSGDFGLIYEPGYKAGVAPGIGLDLVNYKQGLLTLRAEAFFESTSALGSQNATVAGAAILVNLIQLTGQVGGATWLAKAINPSVGIFGGYDFNHGKAAVGPMISIINIAF